MMDLLLRLREMGETASVPPSFIPINRDGHEAAAEIETLRAALLAERERCAALTDAETLKWSHNTEKALTENNPTKYGVAMHTKRQFELHAEAIRKESTQ